MRADSQSGDVLLPDANAERRYASFGAGARIVLAGMVLLLIGMTSATEAALTNDFFALTQAGACKDGVCTGPLFSGPGTVNTLHAFGDVAYGGPNGANSGNGFDSAESLNAQDHFGLDARGSANSTAEPGEGGGWAWGSFGIDIGPHPSAAGPCGRHGRHAGSAL